MVTYCPHCGKPLPADNAEICPNCGVRLRNPPGQDPCGCSSIAAFFFILGGIVFIIATFATGQNWLNSIGGLILIGGGLYFAGKARGWF